MNTPKRTLTEDLHASNIASNTPVSSSSRATDPDLASQLRNVAMRARRNVSQGYATNKDPLQPGPSPRIKSVSATNTIFRSSNDIMHDVFLSNESRFLHASRKRARPEEDAADVDSTIFSRIDEAGTTMTLVNSLDLQAPSRLIKPLRKPGRTALQINSLPASMWSNNPAECTNDVEEEEEEDWSTFDTGSKQSEPMLLS